MNCFAFVWNAEKQKTLQNMAFWRVLYCFEMSFVELAGVEPASKQETEMLSTYLSGYWFSNVVWQSAAELHLSLLFSLTNQDFLPTIPNSRAPLDRKAPGGLAEWRLVPSSKRGIKQNLLYSIKQQEQNYFRLLCFATHLGRCCVGLHAYMSIYPAVKTGQPRINKIVNLRKIILCCAIQIFILSYLNSAGFGFLQG